MAVIHCYLEGHNEEVLNSHLNNYVYLSSKRRSL